MPLERALRMPKKFEIHEPAPEERDEALRRFFAMSNVREEALAAALAPALEKITEALTHHWTTGSGRRLRQIVWSIYNASTLVVLGDALANFDNKLGEAVGTLIYAKIRGVDMDDLLLDVLKRSGEFARYEEAERETPEADEVIYPPLPLSAESLRGLANSATKMETRLEEERRAEARRYENEE